MLNVAKELKNPMDELLLNVEMRLVVCLFV